MAENTSTTNVALGITHDQISYVRETETRYKNSEGDTSAVKQDEAEEEDVVSLAVSLVVSNARQGVVTLCAKVAQILKEKRRLEQKVAQLEQHLLQQQLYGSRRTSEEQSKTYSDRFSFSSHCSAICPYCSGERCGSCPPSLLPQAGLSAAFGDSHHPGLREEAPCAACGVPRRRSAQCAVGSADPEFEPSSRTQNSVLNSEGKRMSVVCVINERKELARDWTDCAKARHEVQTQRQIKRGSIYASSRSLDPQLLINRSRRKFIRSRSICIHRTSHKSNTGKETCGKGWSSKTSGEQDGQGKPTHVEETCSRVPPVNIFAKEERENTSCGTQPRRPTHRSLPCTSSLSTDTEISSQESILCSLDSAYMSQDGAPCIEDNTHRSHSGTRSRYDIVQYRLDNPEQMQDAKQFSSDGSEHCMNRTRNIHDTTIHSHDSAIDTAHHSFDSSHDSYDSTQSSREGSLRNFFQQVSSSIERFDSSRNVIAKTLDSGQDRSSNSSDTVNNIPVHSVLRSCTEGHHNEVHSGGDGRPLQSHGDNLPQEVSPSDPSLTEGSRNNLQVLEAPYPLAGCQCPICQQLNKDQVFVMTAEGEEILKEGSIVLIEGNHIAVVQYMGHDSVSISRNQEVPLSGLVGVHVELWPPDNRKLFIPLDDIICQLEPDDLDDLVAPSSREESQVRGLQKGRKGYSSMQELGVPSADAPKEMISLSESTQRGSLPAEISATRSCIWESYV
ncbi:uncharacterized protein LOC143026201 isoform X2 [Oratosquilla oratoria]|uniref:uncharacterized protein LOC143026201 isoform X2 n=1 Tax=Oratosquilla oratoria TaxID=337810 RepID=UPI003F76260C